MYSLTEDNVSSKIVGANALCSIISFEMIHFGRNSIKGGIPARLAINTMVLNVSLLFLFVSFLSLFVR